MRLISLVIIGLILSSHGPTFSPQSSTTHDAVIANALKWLEVNQNHDGSYGSDPQYIPHWAGAAAYALWLNSSISPKASKSYSWVASQIDNSSSGVWYEADIAGEILYSIAISGNLGLLHNSSDYAALRDFQQSNGGFAGFAEPPSFAPVASAVDTDMALLGLIHARAVNASSQQKATSYLFSLQNTTDGSFALTSNTVYSSFESMAPDPISLTALTLIVLKDVSYAPSDSRISRALDYLERAVSASFKSRVDPSNSTGHVYAAAIAGIAFNDYGMTADALASTAFIITKQNTDGGFRDQARGSTASNALDTAWATIVLQLVSPVPELSPFLPQVVIIGITIGIMAFALVVGIAIYLVRRNKTRTQAKSL